MSSTVARSRTKRAIYLTLGIVMLAIGIVGVWLPLIPTTGPVLLAAWCFARSSERFDQWMLNHRVFGPIVRDWRSGAGFTVRAKIIAVVALVVTFSVSIWFVARQPRCRHRPGRSGHRACGVHRVQTDEAEGRVNDHGALGGPFGRNPPARRRPGGRRPLVSAGDQSVAQLEVGHSFDPAHVRGTATKPESHLLVVHPLGAQRQHAPLQWA